YLKDGQRGMLTPKGYTVHPSKPKIELLDIDPETVKKGPYPHFMLKEIFEGPEVVEAAMRGRLNPITGTVKLGGLEMVLDELRKKNALEIIACGTSYNAGLVGEMLIEEFVGVPTEALLASEYRYKNDAPMKNAAYLFISQSGETADTLAALRKANARKCLTLGLVNVVGSSIARETKAGVYNHAGPEIGVASTKAFLSQLTILTLMALLLGKRTAASRAVMRELSAIPKKISAVLNGAKEVMMRAKQYAACRDFFYLGRGYNYPTALEGALKLKEISYIHAEGYAGGEMKHGPIALIDERFPTVAIATKNALYGKMISNIEEIKARRGKVIAVATEGDKSIAKLADDVLYVPKTLPQLEPLINVVPLQLFAYAVGVGKGYNVDTPRNLAKSVTVE
ncbi:MAG: glutamine--fructose-6-phosphate transaminase (isomerizing), partial [Candidatus Harrisonbacteria bacterium]|nr:glutamine--fructose-6-phosphate transaminase (isomerizing) [Candidatus Harrisonbacteria bacterium]